MGTRANEASRAAAEPLLQAYDAALSDDSSKTQRLGQLLRCALFLSDPACCFAAGDLDGHGERAGQEGASSCGGEEEWASSCAAMRGHVDNALRMHMRCVACPAQSAPLCVVADFPLISVQVGDQRHGDCERHFGIHLVGGRQCR